MTTPLERVALALDPVAFAERAGYSLDPWQRDVMRSRARQLLLNCSRQSGKSTVTGLLAADEIVHSPGVLVLVLAPSLRQGQETYRKVRENVRAVGDLAPAVVQESTLSLELASGARLVVVPGADGTARGYSAPSLVIVDEASRIDDALIGAVRPMLAVSNGRLVMLSTPAGKRGAFYEAWERGGDEWQRFRVTAEQCPRIAPEWLATERRSLPSFVFRQEYECEFLDDATNVFGADAVRRALTRDVTPLFPQERVA